ncbi:MAG: SEC-C domain-containing protein [Pirellulales bacterium]|nr:SEC-C domain-containing protein [Pirellulales bacterium]
MNAEVKQLRDKFKASPRKHHMRRVGRNDPCPCGSGKKFKRCCGARNYVI